MKYGLSIFMSHLVSNVDIFFLTYGFKSHKRNILHIQEQKTVIYLLGHELHARETAASGRNTFFIGHIIYERERKSKWNCGRLIIFRESRSNTHSQRERAEHDNDTRAHIYFPGNCYVCSWMDREAEEGRGKGKKRWEIFFLPLFIFFPGNKIAPCGLSLSLFLSLPHWRKRWKVTKMHGMKWIGSRAWKRDSQAEYFSIWILWLKSAIEIFAFSQNWARKSL